MSAHAKNANRHLLFQDAVNFLQSKNISAICPCCGHDQASILCDAQQNEYASIYEVNPLKLVTGGFGGTDHTVGSRLFMVECESCGYFRHYGVQRAFNWLDMQEETLK